MKKEARTCRGGYITAVQKVAEGVCDLLVKRIFPPAYVIRLSLGKLLVNLLQVVKRTNTPLIT